MYQHGFKRGFRQHRSYGFTMIEAMIILAVIVILSALVMPSFWSLLDSIKLNQCATELRTSLVSGQRQAIRSGQTCLAGVRVQDSDGGNVTVINDLQSVFLSHCLAESDLPEGGSVVSNIVPGIGAIAESINAKALEEDALSQFEQFLNVAVAWSCKTYGTFCSSDSGNDHRWETLHHLNLEKQSCYDY